MNKRYRVLLVDDDPVNVKVMQRALRDRYEISVAHGGMEAMQAIRENAPDLIIMDVMMPDMSGFDVCREMKADERFADIPLLFASGLDDFDSEIMGLGLGGIDYLKKPIDVDLLRQRVLNHIELKRRSDLLREQRDLLAQQKAELEAALARVKRLEGILPICMYCKRIKDDRDSWEQIESYISEHSDALFSHGMCPSCYAEQFGDETGA